MGPKGLVERVASDQCSQLSDHCRVMATGKVGLDPPCGSHETELLEPVDVRLRERLVAEVGERRTAPQTKGLTEQSGGLGRLPVSEGLAALAGQTLEARCVHGLRGDLEDVPG